MRFIWEVLPTANWVVSLVVICGVYGGLFFIFSKIVKRRAGYIFLSIVSVFALVTYLLAIEYVFVLVATATAAGVTIALFANLGDLRHFLANPFKISHTKSSKLSIEKIYNKAEFYKIIEAAVLQLSRTRTGAIITFEKNTSLADIMKNGVPVNAPVTSELLTTIFYPGTRLHDGAVIIKDNTIVCASVFYTPTTKPFAGKYGSRHRAALGISEISDAITVVVSEETGRISLAVNGQLETATQDTFLRVFENYMDGAAQ